MKKNYLLIITVLLVSFQNVFSNPYIIPSEQFPTLESAVTFINSTVPETDLIFFIEGDKIFDEPSLVINARGSETAGIVLMWNGSGSKPVVNFSGTTADKEAGFVLSGASYITLDGLDIRNSDGMLEYGVFVTNSNTELGSQRNTIMNCSITLNKTNTFQTHGVLILPTEVATSANGSNSYNYFLNNHVSNALHGYKFDSGTGIVEFMDTGNHIGITWEGEHVIEDVVMASIYLLNQNGAFINGVKMLNLKRPSDGTSAAPAGISTTGLNPVTMLTAPFIISNNIIKGHHSDATSIFGMYLNQRKAEYLVFNNLVDSINTSGTTSTASGIFVFGTDVSAFIYNNKVFNISAPDASSSTAASTRGIDVRSFSRVGIYHNTVYLNYNATNPNNRSGALNVHNVTDQVELRNNIFINHTTIPEGGTGFAAAFYKNSVALTNVLSTSDNNIYFAGEPSPQNFIFYGHASAAARDQTLAEYKERAWLFDQNSFTENVPFTNDNTPSVDPDKFTVARGNATPIIGPIPIANDFYGNLRDENFPDIGAEELRAPAFRQVINPTPVHNAVDVSLSLAGLSWEYTPNESVIPPAGFRVNLYAGEEIVTGYPIWVAFDETTTLYSLSLTDGVLTHSTEYIWEVVPVIDEHRGNDPFEAMKWSFSTIVLHPYPGQAVNPSPSAMQQSVLVSETALNWEYYHEEQYLVPSGFKVFFGEELPLTEEHFQGWIEYNISEQNYLFELPLSALQFDNTYYWQVVPAVEQENGPFTPAPESWSFTTERYIFPFPALPANPVPSHLATGVILQPAEFSWKYIHHDSYTLPSGFKLLLGTSPVVEELQVEAWIDYVSASEDFSVTLPGLVLEPFTTYYWMPLAVVKDNDTELSNPETALWQFTTLDNTSVEWRDKERFIYYPNPSSGKLNIKMLAEGEIQINDISGRMVYSSHLLRGSSMNIELTHLKEGIYTITYIEKSRISTGKLFIQK